MTILVSLINNNIHKINFQELQTYYKLYWAITNFIEQIHLSVSGPETKKTLASCMDMFNLNRRNFCSSQEDLKNSVNFLYRKYHIQFFFFYMKKAILTDSCLYIRTENLFVASKRAYSYSVICCYFHEKTWLECLGKPWYKKGYVYGES